MDSMDDENIEWLMESSKTVENMVDDFEIRLDRISDTSTISSKFMELCRIFFTEEPKVENNKVIGVLNNSEDLKRFVTKLKALGYFYYRRNSKQSKPTKSRMMIQRKDIPFCGHPFIINSKVYYLCHKAASGYKKIKKTETPSKVAEGSSVCNEASCQAMIVVREVDVFTGVQIPEQKKSRILIMKKFRRIFNKNSSAVETKKCVYVTISMPEVHNHGIALTGRRPHVNEEVKAAMHSVLNSGITKIPEIQKALKKLVNDEYKTEVIQPSIDNPAFYPNQHTIYNHLRLENIDTKRKKKTDTISKLANLRNKLREDLNYILNYMETSEDLDVLTNVSRYIRNVRQKLELLDS